MSKYRYLVCALVLALAVGGLMMSNATAAYAQNNTATLSGTSINADTAALVGAVKIVVTNVGTNVRREVTSDKDGKYSIPQLAPGQYELEAVREGVGTTTIHAIVLKAGEKKDLMVALRKPLQ